MRDLNFFEPYIEKRELKFNKMILLYMLLALAIAGVAGFGVYNQLQINALNAQAASLRLTAEEPKTVEKYNEIKELEKQMAVFKEEVDKIIKLDKSIAQSDIINVDLISKIKSKMPEDLFLTNLNVSGREMQISGVAKDSNSIAEFSKGLKLIDDVESVFISIINNVDGNYSFVLNTTFKDVSIDEQ